MNNEMTPQFAQQLATAIKPDLWDRMLGPSAALVLALVILYVLWKKWEKIEARADAREDAITARLQKTEDDMRTLQTDTIKANTHALEDLNKVLAALPCNAWTSGDMDRRHERAERSTPLQLPPSPVNG